MSVHKRRAITQQQPLEQNDIVQKVMQFLKAPEQFQIAPVCKIFYKLSHDPNSFGEQKFMLIWKKEVVPPGYSRLGFIESDFDQTEVCVGGLFISLSELTPQSQRTLLNLITSCKILNNVLQIHWHFDSIKYSLPNLKYAQIQKNPLINLGEENLKNIHTLKIFHCSYKNLENVFFGKLRVLKFIHTFRSNWPRTDLQGKTDLEKFCVSVPAVNLPNLLTISIGYKTLWYSDLSKINLYPQVRTLHLQFDNTPMNNIFPNIQCLILSEKCHNRQSRMYLVGHPPDPPSIDLNNGFLAQFPNLKYFYTDFVIKNSENIPEFINVQDLSLVENVADFLHNLYIKKY